MMYILDTCVVGMQSSSFRDHWLFGCIMKLGSRKMIDAKKPGNNSLFKGKWKVSQRIQ